MGWIERPSAQDRECRRRGGERSGSWLMERDLVLDSWHVGWISREESGRMERWTSWAGRSSRSGVACGC